MKTGFIFEIVKVLIETAVKLNLVELFKLVGIKLNPHKNDPEKVRAAERIATDIFIVLKWVFVIVVWNFSVAAIGIILLVWYLIFSNLFTYFYYHIWCDDALQSDTLTRDRVRRRFINLMLAVAFSVFCFGFLFDVAYPQHFNWGEKSPLALQALTLSFGTAFAGNSGGIHPVSDFATILCNTEFLITVLFVSIILGRSLPQTSSPT